MNLTIGDFIIIEKYTIYPTISIYNPIIVTTNLHLYLRMIIIIYSMFTVIKYYYVIFIMKL